MKKTYISLLAVGLLFSGVQAFAEQENNQFGEGRGLIRALSVRHENEEENEHGNEKKQDRYYFGTGVGMTVRDDVKIPSLVELGSVGTVSENLVNMSITKLAILKAKANQLIKERLNALTANKQAIEANKSLTTEQKTALTTLLATNISGLTALQSQIASSTDATSTKAIITSVYTNFRVFGIVIPQVRLEKRIFDLQNHSQKLSDTFLKVQAKIDEYKGKGKDVTEWQANLESAKASVALDMNTLAQELVKVQALTPAQYGTSSKAVIESANATIKKVAQDFASIAKKLNKAKVLKDKRVNATSTPTTTGTTTSSTGSSLPVMTMAQVATHATPADCWIVVSQKVYSVSGYLTMHPGGQSAITSQCGKDATTAFDTRGGTGAHSSSARATLGSFLVGTL